MEKKIKKLTAKYIKFQHSITTMNLKVFLVLSILVAALPVTVVQAQGHRVMTATIETESGRRTVEIRYYPESEEWAKDVFRTIKEGFPLLEKKIGVPCPTAWDIIVEETTSLEAGVAGVNRGPLGMTVPTGISPAVIIHELCHYWFGSHLDLRWSNWILEGFPEAYTVAVLKELGHPEGYSHWSARLDQYERARAELGDKPLSEVGYTPNFEDPRVALLYSKAMVYCTWLITFFGEETMHKINAQAIPTNPLRADDYQEILEDITEQDLGWLFSGWVYEGAYYYQGQSVSFEWFAGDGDKDGILTLEEIEMGFSPQTADMDRDGLPDGYELLLKTDLRNPDTDNDGVPDGEEVAIIVDGKNTEWSTPVVTDQQGDSASPDPQDVKALYYATDDTSVYFLIEFYNPVSKAYHNGIQFDVDDDGETDFIFYIIYDRLFLSIWENGEAVEVVTDPQLLKGAIAVTNQVIEFRLPKRMRQVRFPSSFNVFSYEFSVVDRDISDSTASITLSLDQNAVESTNPFNPDTDGDGTIDGEDDDPLVLAEKSTEVPTEEVTEEGIAEKEEKEEKLEKEGEQEKEEEVAAPQRFTFSQVLLVMILLVGLVVLLVIWTLRS